MPDPEQLLLFWFGDLTDGFSNETQRGRWFGGGSEFDESCRDWGDSLRAAVDGELDHWLTVPRTRLAFIVLTDQIPRNIYRGSARAYATDKLARDAAAGGVLSRMDRELEFDERCFFYLPFEHSESVLDQHACVGLLSELRDRTPTGHRHLTGGYLNYAHQHRDIVLRFGRFPHRNRVLGRESTSEEVEFLEAGNDFGQSSS